MITMKRVDSKHILVLDVTTDKSHLVSMLDSEQKPILTFDKDLYCFDSNGTNIAKIRLNPDSQWIVSSQFDFEIEPVSFNIPKSVFCIEAAFCKKWLETQFVLS